MFFAKFWRRAYRWRFDPIRNRDALVFVSSGMLGGGRAALASLFNPPRVIDTGNGRGDQTITANNSQRRLRMEWNYHYKKHGIRAGGAETSETTEADCRTQGELHRYALFCLQANTSLPVFSTSTETFTSLPGVTIGLR